MAEVVVIVVAVGGEETKAGTKVDLKCLKRMVQAKGNDSFTFSSKLLAIVSSKSLVSCSYNNTDEQIFFFPSSDEKEAAFFFLFSCLVNFYRKICARLLLLLLKDIKITNRFDLLFQKWQKIS